MGDKRLEEITLETLAGRWKSSLGDTVKVKGARAGSKLAGVKYKLVQQGVTVELIVSEEPLIAYKALPERSSGSTIRWMGPDDLEVSWSFQGDCTDEVGGKKSFDDGVEAMDESNIISSKRRRTQVDYVRLNKKMGGKGPKKIDRAGDEGASVPQPEPEPEPEPAPVEPLTPAGIEQIAADLEAAGQSLKPRRYVLPLVGRLSDFPMDLSVLTQTKIGKALNPYRKHEDGVVAKQVSALISKWKALVKS